MANLQNFSVVRNGSVTTSVPRYTIAGQIVDDDGTIVNDLTGANALSFPAVLTTLTATQRDALLRWLGSQLIYITAGIDTGQ